MIAFKKVIMSLTLMVACSSFAMQDKLDMGTYLLGLLSLKDGARQVTAFCPDNSKYILVNEDGTATAFDSKNHHELFTLSHHKKIKSIAFSKDSMVIIGLFGDGTGILWHAKDRQHYVILELGQEDF